MAKLIVRGTRKHDAEAFQRCLQVKAMAPGQFISLVTTRNVQLEVERARRGVRISSSECAVNTPLLDEEVALSFLRRLGAL